MGSIAVARESTLLLFGDQTDAFYPTIKRLYTQSASNPQIRSFLQDATAIVRSKTNSFEPSMRNSLGGPFIDLLQLAERFRDQEDLDGVAHTILITVMRAAVLLQYVEEDSSLLSQPVYLAGACGGLLNAAALAAATDAQSLYQSSLTVVELVCRLTDFLISRSRAIEDVRDSWGWSVVGVRASDLQSHLDQFHDTANIPPHRRVKIGASGLQDAWHTIIGPPSVLAQFFASSPAARALGKQKLRISTLVHVMSDVAEEEIDYVLGSSPLVDTPVQPQFTVISLGSNAAYAERTWGALMRAVLRDICSQPLNMANGLPALDAALSSSQTVRLKAVAPTLHLAAVSSFLGETDREVTVVSEPEPNSGSNDGRSGRIAIVGMSGRYPASNDLEEFWEKICQGQALHSEIPRDRFDLDAFYDKSAAAHCSTSTKYGCFLKDPGLFDARFFNMSPREALYLDPAQRLFLMATYEALETAGYARSRLNGGDSSRVGTFVGQAAEEWRDVGHAREYDAYSLTGLQRSFGSGRVNHHFKWHGPAVSLDTACSSGLTAIHLACLALQAGECDVAVAGGTNVLSSPVNFHLLSKAGFLSTTGGCKTYRDDADGYCRGDFVGSFVLKRLEDAVADNDNILSVIAGSARNHSTYSTSITQSDHRAQEHLMCEVLRKAGMEPADVSYVEMHGTGTQVGDVAEMTAVTNTFGGKNNRRQAPLRIGTIKSNIGHGEGAAGAAALIKAIQMFQKGIIPPQAGLPSRLNPKFPNLADLNIEIPEQLLESRPQTVLLNSFDASGGNTCLLLEAPQAQEPVSHDFRDPRSSHVVVLSAKTAGAHEANKRRLLRYLQEAPDTRLEDLAYTTTARRLHHPIRSAYVASSIDDLVRKLESEPQQRPAPARRPAPVIFTFTGQGSLYAGMGAHLYRTSPAFRTKLDLCARLCRSRNFPPFLDIIVDEDEVDVSEKSAVQTQLAMVALEIALAAFWASCGVVPDAVVGHSLGEYAALHVAGVLSLADALFLVGRRAELMLERCQAGSHAMLAVSASKGDVQGCLGSQGGQVACINGPRTTVVSGKVGDIEALASAVKSNGARCTVLPVPYAFHSSQLDPVLDELAACAKGVEYKAPRISVASTLTGELVAGPGIFDATYSVRQTREPVNFVGAVSAIDGQLKDCLWLEIGPGSVCTGLVRQIISSARTATSLQEGVSDWTTVSGALAAAYESQIDVDWAGVHKPFEAQLRLLSLPSYAFETSNYWMTYPVHASTTQEKVESGPVQRRMISTCLQHVVSESDTQITFRSDLSDPSLRAIGSGHCLMGVAVVPGSVFGDMAVTAAKYLVENSSRRSDVGIANFAMRDGTFLHPVVLRSGESDQVLTVTASKSKTATAVKMSSASTDLAVCRVVESDPRKTAAEWAKISHFILSRCKQVMQDATENRGHRISAVFLYALFGQTVEYADAYRRIREAYISQDFREAATELDLAPSPDGSSFALSPYWIDSLVHLAGFLVNANPSRKAGSLAMFSGFDAFDIVEELEPGKPYTVYARAGDLGKHPVTTDVYVFSGEKLVMQYSGMRFHTVDAASFARLLGAPVEPRKAAASQRHPAIPAQPVRAEAPLPQQRKQSAKPGNTGAEKKLLDIIASQTGCSASDLTDSTYLADVGVDSIMSIQLGMEVQDQLGLDVGAAFFREHPTIGAVKKAFGELLGAEQESPQPQEPAPKTEGDFVQALLGCIARQTGTPASDLADDSTVLADIGVDSIMSVQIATEVHDETGVDLGASALREYRTVGDLREAFGSTQSKQPAVKEEQPNPDSQLSTRAATPSSSGSEPEVSNEPSRQTQQQQQQQAGELIPQPSAPATTPEPRVNVVLLHGRASSKLTPFFLVPDGTGAAATYIYLKRLSNARPVYALESPFLKCASKFTVGAEAVASMFADAVRKTRPQGPYILGGYSGGSILAYETARQLAVAGERVQGLLLYDMCAPQRRPDPHDAAFPKVMVELMVRLLGGSRNAWLDSHAAHDPQTHMKAMVRCVSTYDPKPMPPGRGPARTTLTWCKRGVAERLDDKAIARLKQHGIDPYQSVANFMEDPNVGPFSWTFPPNKPLGPNGWERLVEGVRCSAIDADHFSMVVPPDVSKFQKNLEESLAYVTEGADE